MKLHFLDVLLTVLALVYVARLLYFLVGFKREMRRWTSNHYVPLISIIIPARNEEQNLERCLASIMRVDYPPDRLEVIVVNDRSSDRTGEVLDRFASQYSNVLPLHRTDADAVDNLRGKAGALQFGIDRSHGEIILMTDADCTVSPTWPRAITAQFANDHVGLVSGLTSVEGSTFLERTQDVEWTYMQAMACGGVGNHHPLGCFGNNLAVRRDVFVGLGGYRGIDFSVTEDMALQHAVFDAGHEIRFFIHPSISVVTRPADSLMEYIRQRHRWVRGGIGLGARGAIFVLTSLALWSGLVMTAIAGLWWWFAFFIALRVIADTVLISGAAISVGRRRVIPVIIPALLLLSPTEIFLPILAAMPTVKWKGQIFKR